MAEVQAGSNAPKRRDSALRMRNTKSVCNLQTFQRMSVVFGRNAEHSKHTLYLQFQVRRVKPGGGGRCDKTDFKGALTQRLRC